MSCCPPWKAVAFCDPKLEEEKKKKNQESITRIKIDRYSKHFDVEEM